jgi:RimJ/RimL family protein N-acetyltransferase
MLRGQQIQLRALERDDLPRMRDWRNLPELRRHFREFRELNLVNQEQWFTRISSSPNDFMFLIERADDRTPIGVCGLVYVHWVLRSADLSLYIGHDETYIDGPGGYAEEAARILVRYAFNNLNMHKVWTELYSFDERKIALYTRLGFSRDAVLRDNCYEDGGYHDSYIYSLIRAAEAREPTVKLVP